MKFTAQLISLSMLMFVACIQTPPSKITQAEWLLGTWERRRPHKVSYEQWQKVDDLHYQAKGYSLKGLDTLVSETILLQQEDDQVCYIPTVPDQNAGKSIRFLMTAINDSSMTFENPAHDFPQIIQYTRMGKDSLVATTVGIQGNDTLRFHFYMRRLR